MTDVGERRMGEGWLNFVANSLYVARRPGTSLALGIVDFGGLSLATQIIWGTFRFSNP